MSFYALRVKAGCYNATYTGADGAEFVRAPMTYGSVGFLPISDAYSRGCCEPRLHDWAPVTDLDEARTALARYLTQYPNAAGQVELVLLPYLFAKDDMVCVVGDSECAR